MMSNLCVRIMFECYCVHDYFIVINLSTPFEGLGPSSLNQPLNKEYRLQSLHTSLYFPGVVISR